MTMYDLIEHCNRPFLRGQGATCVRGGMGKLIPIGNRKGGMAATRMNQDAASLIFDTRISLS